MPHKLRKIRKKRGTRTQGYGRVGQHRKGGSRGKRKVGRHKQLWSYVTSYEPDYFKKVGFTSHRSLGREVNTMNIGELEELAQNVISKRRGHRETKILIDLEELGYNKLLGKGNITKPVHVKVPSCSETAAKKIEAVGGQVSIKK